MTPPPAGTKRVSPDLPKNRKVWDPTELFFQDLSTALHRQEDSTKGKNRTGQEEAHFSPEG